ncbi:MAG: DUF3303 family protein [Planctomycetales bacterium]|nr:DUF3303 family protein [Planctomycetales bacterium]
MKFMVTFALTHRDYKERVARFLETGAPPPEGAEMLGRWFTASHNKGFMLVETDKSDTLFRWTSEWADLIDFQIEPVVTEDTAAAILQELR